MSPQALIIKKMLTHIKTGGLQIFLTWLISILHLFVYWRYIITYDFEVYDFYYLFSANSIFLLLGLVLFHLRVIKGLRYVLVMATLVQIAGVCWQYYSIGEFLDQLIPVVVLAGLSFWWMKKEPAMYVKKTTSDVPVSSNSRFAPILRVNGSLSCWKQPHKSTFQRKIWLVWLFPS